MKPPKITHHQTLLISDDEDVVAVVTPHLNWAWYCYVCDRNGTHYDYRTHAIAGCYLHLRMIHGIH